MMKDSKSKEFSRLDHLEKRVDGLYTILDAVVSHIDIQIQEETEKRVEDLRILFNAAIEHMDSQMEEICDMVEEKDKALIESWNKVKSVYSSMDVTVSRLDNMFKELK